MPGITFGSNPISLTIQNGLSRTTSSLNKSLQRLSTGIKLNSAGDGSAELTMASYYEGQARGSAAASKNVDMGLAMLNTADEGLAAIEEHLQRVRELAVSGANTGLSATDLAAINGEIAQRFAAIDAVSNNTTMNGLNLLDGTTGTVNIQAGLGGGSAIAITAGFTDATAATIVGAGNFTTITNSATAGTVITEVDTALQNLATSRRAAGRQMNILTQQQTLLQAHQANSEAVRSTLRDTDVAQETANMTRLQILQQAGVSALSQANSYPSIALKLLQ
jgi:flagellin